MGGKCEVICCQLRKQLWVLCTEQVGSSEREIREANREALTMVQVRANNNLN